MNVKLRKISTEVFVAEDSIVRIGDSEISFLKQQARLSPRKRARICAHKSDQDPLHEMLIAISNDSYIHPHRHINKSESFHILDGQVDVVVFDNEGTIAEVIRLGPQGSGRSFYYRLSESAFHTLLIRSDVLVVHEVTNGPFARNGTMLAPFAPPEDQAVAAHAYMQNLSARVRQHLGGLEV